MGAQFAESRVNSSIRFSRRDLSGLLLGRESWRRYFCLVGVRLALGVRWHRFLSWSLKEWLVAASG